MRLPAIGCELFAGTYTPASNFRETVAGSRELGLSMPLSGDPCVKVRRAVQQLGAILLALREKTNHVHVNQADFLQIQRQLLPIAIALRF